MVIGAEWECPSRDIPKRLGGTMLLEELLKEAERPPEYDWDAYYRWLYGQLSGKEEAGFWLCPECLSVNVAHPPVRYGKCRGCGVIHLPSGH